MFVLLGKACSSPSWMRWVVAAQSGVLSFSVCQVPIAEGKSVQQTVDVLQKKLEQLGSVKQGSFCVDCETYHATGNVVGKLATFSSITRETY